MKKSIMLLTSLFLLGSGLYMGWSAHEDSLNFTNTFGGSTARISQEAPENSETVTEALTDASDAEVGMEEDNNTTIDVMDAADIANATTLENALSNTPENTDETTDENVDESTNEAISDTSSQEGADAGDAINNAISNDTNADAADVDSNTTNEN